MRLVKTSSNSYINMDTIESIFEDVKRVRCISGEIYNISKEAYETILKYGKTKV